ncbi:MAG: 16S rRNA (guanine(966)-N(2))-methyltransferase RsmD [bacterium]
MRIVGGALKGHSLVAPKGLRTRPTTDRIRESLFNILEHNPDWDLAGKRCIDLFAGSGALGIEALSRGAAWCLFVEEASAARAAIRKNIEAMNLFGQSRIHRRSAIALGKIPASTGGVFQVAFLDAPYDRGLSDKALSGLHEGGWLQPGAICIVEQAKHEKPALPNPFQEQDRRLFGDTQIGILQYQEESVL